MSIVLGLDIGSNSVGSAWFDRRTGDLATGISIFPAGVDESDQKRGEPKNAKRRMMRRARITLARRAERKRKLRLKLISVGLLPADTTLFKQLLEDTDPWLLRRKGLDSPLSPHEFGRVLLHLAQRRGALGLSVADPDASESDAVAVEEGKVYAGIDSTRRRILEKQARSFGEFMAMVREERVTSISTKDRRAKNTRIGPRQHRGAIRNKAASYEHCADRDMIRDEFAMLWDTQKRLGGEVAEILTDDLRMTLDDKSRDSDWRHKGLLFGQRRQSWDVGTLGRCVLEPTERCVPHADMYASRYLVVETVNNLKIIERGTPARSLTPEERSKIKAYLSGPLGEIKTGKYKGNPKHSVSVTDLRQVMDWGRASKNTQYRFNIEVDEDRLINTDWFSREIIHEAITCEKWETLPERVQEGLNHALLKFDPNEVATATRLKRGVMDWAGLTHEQAEALVDAWKKRPKLDAKRLNISRRAVRNLLVHMDRTEPWPDDSDPGGTRWLTQIEARKLIAQDADFLDVTTGQAHDDHARRRYATGAKGATARDRHYMRKHLLLKNGEPIYGADGTPLAEPPPAPLIRNPVVRKAIHEVRRHVVEYMTTYERKPDEIYIELSREARMGKKDADRLLSKNRLRNRIRRDIIEEFQLDDRTATQQRAAVTRVILCAQQCGVCALCGNQRVKTSVSFRMATEGEGCEVAHIIPKASGGHNGLGNVVLAHTKCNRDMGRRTPREYWSTCFGDGFDEGIRFVEGIYQDIGRPKYSEIKNAKGDSLWSCFFNKRDDTLKIDQFKKDIKDIQGMTKGQEAATKYASRQVMAYLADALYEGKGLPERGGDRQIYATDGLWTSRLRREWGLFFDPHASRSKNLDVGEEHVRKEKNRGDHRHHAVDAVVTALCSQRVQNAWEDRERRADQDGVNTADEQAVETYRRSHPLDPPAPFKSREAFREAVKKSIFGAGEVERPICHRPVKRKLIGPLHKETLYGPVLDTWVRNGKVYREQVSGRVTVRQNVLGETQNDFLKPSHLRLPRPEKDAEAVERLARRLRVGVSGLSKAEAFKVARKRVKSSGFTRAMVDPKPEKGGIVRDVDLRRILRRQLEAKGLDPDTYTKLDLKKTIDSDGPLRHDSGVPIHRVVLLWSNSNPVTIRRSHHDHASGTHQKLDDLKSVRLYDSQNNHHIEIRVDSKGKWSGLIVSAFTVSERKRKRSQALSEANVPKSSVLRKLPKKERKRWHKELADVEKANPLVDRRDDEIKGGVFVMSMCEGETLYMRHKETDEPGYFVVAKLDKPQSVVLVPHWDARAATERKDPSGKNIPDSKRTQFSVTPTDLKALAPPGHPQAVKVRVSPLSKAVVLKCD